MSHATATLGWILSGLFQGIGAEVVRPFNKISTVWRKSADDSEIDVVDILRSEELYEEVEIRS